VTVTVIVIANAPAKTNDLCVPRKRKTSHTLRRVRAMPSFCPSCGARLAEGKYDRFCPKVSVWLSHLREGVFSLSSSFFLTRVRVCAVWARCCVGQCHHGSARNHAVCCCCAGERSSAGHAGQRHALPGAGARRDTRHVPAPHISTTTITDNSARINVIVATAQLPPQHTLRQPRGRPAARDCWQQLRVLPRLRQANKLWWREARDRRQGVAP
jgi:hypothetical protein